MEHLPCDPEQAGIMAHLRPQGAYDPIRIKRLDPKPLRAGKREISEGWEIDLLGLEG